MLVPAWDFRRDGRLHARMAVVRGVENGFALARSAAMGRLTVSDSHGRDRGGGDDLRARPGDRAGGSRAALRRARSTARWGDLFGWLTVAGAAALLAVRALLTARR